MGTETWNYDHFDTMIVKVCNHIKKVLILTVEGNGKNDLIETKPGKNFANLDLPLVFNIDTPPAFTSELDTASKM